MTGLLLIPERLAPAEKQEKHFAEADGYLFCKNCRTVTPQKEYRRTMYYKCLLCGKRHYASPHSNT